MLLAKEQYRYCYDIVDQGTGTIAALVGLKTELTVASKPAIGCILKWKLSSPLAAG
jgi:hypothetical protein